MKVLTELQASDRCEPASVDASLFTGGPDTHSCLAPDKKWLAHHSSLKLVFLKELDALLHGGADGA
jgi:hypothetical protein